MHGTSYHDTTQGRMLERLAAEHTHAEALVFPARGLSWSWRELDDRSIALARGLIALGIEPGERVTVWSDNRPDWIALQFALARIGAVLVTANTALQKAEIGYLLRQSGSSALIASAGFQDREYFDAIVELIGSGELPDLRHAIALEAEAPADMIPLDELLRRGASVESAEVHCRTAATRPGDPTNIQYTSGTTGFPKGVVLTHRNIVENGWAIAAGLRLHGRDRVLIQVPLFHCFGCVIAVLGCVTHAATMVLMRRFDPGEALETVVAERCTVIHGVPTMFHAMLSHPRFTEYSFEHLRTGVMAGSMCPESLMRRVVNEMNCAGMLVAYGLTEASPAVTMSALDDSIEVRCGTVGRALDGVEVRIADPATGESVPPGESGELWARGPNVMRGYFDKPEETAQAITADGWLRTGDLATLDDDGLVRIVGRIKEMIIRGGENVYPAEVEEALREHPEVADAAVFGLPSEPLGEEVAAAIILEPGSELSPEELLSTLPGRLAHYKRPTRVQFVESFPLTGSGKVRKFRLVEAFVGS